jgi:transposase
VAGAGTRCIRREHGQRIHRRKGFRKFVRSSGARFAIDEDKIKEEARFDGKWVLRTNTELSASDVALKYKQLWTVEDIFRSMKSLLATRPIYHKCDETIRGHVFCSFLALMLRKALQDKLDEQCPHTLEWDRVVKSLNDLRESEVTVSGKRFVFRDECMDPAGHVLRAVGVALPPTLREIA